jgi:hypothetical protein
MRTLVFSIMLAGIFIIARKLYFENRIWKHERKLHERLQKNEYFYKLRDY